jgi:two-component system NtrC family response regulator
VIVPRVLVIDDDAIAQRLAVAASRDAGMEADAAADLAAVSAMVAATRYDAIILDHHVGDVLGHEILEEVADRLAQAALIVVTADTSDEVRERYARIGAVRLVLKPLSRPRLADEIRAALAR